MNTEQHKTEIEGKSSVLMQKSEKRSARFQETESSLSPIDLSTLLRRVGGLVLVGSALTFLLQRWVGMDSVLRYYAFLGFTLSLTAVGVFCALRIKEEKGARTFLSIAAMFLPAHFTQIGALLYSLTIENHSMQFLEQNDYLRNLAIYQAPSPLVAFGTLAISVLTMLPVVYFGFSSMARVESRRLTLWYFLGSALLLLPTRDPYIISALVASAVLILSYLDISAFSKDSAMKTFEGYAMRAMMFVPVILLLGRSVLLYPSAGVLSGAVCLLLAFVLFEVLPKLLASESAKCFFQSVSLFPLVASWAFVAEDLFFSTQAPFELSRSYTGIACAIPMSIMIALLSFRAVSGGKGFRVIASLLAVGSSTIHLLDHGGIPVALLCLLLSIAVLAMAVEKREKSPFWIGVIGLLVSLFYHARSAFDIFSVSPWLSLAVVGTSLVLFASYLEANQGYLKERLNVLKNRYSALQ